MNRIASHNYGSINEILCRWQRHSTHTCAAVQVSEAYHLHRDNDDCRHYHYHRNHHHHLGHQHPSSISKAASHELSLACRLSSHLQPEPSKLLLLSLELEPISKPAQSITNWSHSLPLSSARSPSQFYLAANQSFSTISQPIWNSNLNYTKQSPSELNNSSFTTKCSARKG